jgi:hypothetical protein
MSLQAAKQLRVPPDGFIVGWGSVMLELTTTDGVPESTARVAAYAGRTSNMYPTDIQSER